MSRTWSQWAVAALTAVVVMGCPPKPPEDPTPDPTRSTVEVDRSAGVLADGADAVKVTVTVLDEDGAPMAGQTVVLAASGSSNTLDQPATTDASGVATGTLRSTQPGVKTLSATAGGIALAAKPAVTFVAPPVGTRKLVFLRAPPNGRLGQALSPAVQVAIADSAGVPTSTGSALISLQLGGGTTGAHLTGTLSVAAVDGVATFPDLTLDAVGTGYTLTASAANHASGTSAAFDVTAGVAHHLTFRAQPTNTLGHVALAPVQVAVVDAAGNTVDDGRTVTLALKNNPGNDTLTQGTSATAVHGVATFSNLSLSVIASGYTLLASAVGLTSEESAPFDILLGPPHHLAFQRQPSSAASGAAIAPAIQVAILDVGGNVVTSAAVTIVLALANNPGGDTLTQNKSAVAIAGVATFPALALQRAASGYTLSASGGGLPLVESAPFDITSGPAHHLAFVAQPTSTVSQVAIAPAVSVELLDAAGNRTADTRTVTLALANNPGGDTLTQNNTVAAVAGVATFSAVSLRIAASGYTLSASATGLTPAESAAFAITPGPAAALTVRVQPVNADVGKPFTPIAVGLRDAAGNTVSTDGVTITAALPTQPDGDLQGTLAEATLSGVATFDDLRSARAKVGAVLQFTSPGLTPVSSQPFDVLPGAPAQIAFTGAVGNGQALKALTGTQVQALDAFGNATSASGTVTLALSTNPTGATLFGTTTVSFSPSGKATFVAWINTLGTGYRLQASWDGKQTSPSNAFSISPGDPSVLTLVNVPTTALAGVAITPAIQVLITDGAGNSTPAATGPITLALSGGDPTATLSGTKVVNAVNAVATFPGLSIDKVGADYVLLASGYGDFPYPSDAFKVRYPPVTGSRVVRYRNDADEVTPTPQDLSAAPIAAWVSNGSGGYTRYPGTGLADGTFSIPDVPFGPYYLQYFTDYFATSARVVDLGNDELGRPGAVRATDGSNTSLQLDLAGLAPYQDADGIQLFSPDTQTWVDFLQYYDQAGTFPAVDDTRLQIDASIDQLAAAGYLIGLPEASHGDRMLLTQLSAAAPTPGLDTPCITASRAFLTQSLTITPGTSPLLSGTFTSLPQDQTFDAVLQLEPSTPGSFGSYAAAIHPTAQPVGGSVVVDGIPRTDRGFYASSPDYVSCGFFGTEPDVHITVPYGDPLPGYARFGYAFAQFRTRYPLLRGDGSTTLVSGFANVSYSDVLPGMQLNPLRPQLGTVRGPRLNGQDLFTDVTVTDRAEFTWGVPSVGMATHYVIRLREIFVDAGGIGRRSAILARLVTTNPSAALPNLAVLQPGHTYYVTIGAEVRAGIDVERTPYLLAFPASTTEVLSGIIRR